MVVHEGNTASQDAHVSAARVRVALLVSSVAAGLCFARWLWGTGTTVPSWSWFAVGGLPLAACMAARGDPLRWVARTGACMAVACLAAGVFTARTMEVPEHRIDRLVMNTGILTVEGRACDNPSAVRQPGTVLGRFERREASWTLVVVARSVKGGGGWTAATGKVRVFVRGPSCPGVHAGDVIRVTGEFEPERDPMNPGDESGALVRNQAGRAGVLSVTAVELIEEGDADAWDRLLGAVLRGRAALRDRAQQVVRQAAGEDDPAHRGLFESLMLGRTEEGWEAGEVTGTFTRLGLLHVLSISGFHLTVMAALALWLLRLTGDRGRLEPLALGAIVLAYMAIVPASSPILRSGLMVVSLLAVEATGRRYDRLCVLGWIAVALLLWRPMDLWNLGFQLSLGLTAMLLSAGERFTEGMFTPVLKGLVDDATLFQRARRGMRAAVAVSVMCWVVSLPVIMHTTGLVSPVAVLATLALSPVIVALLWVGYVALLAGVVVPGAGGMAAWIVEQLCGLALWASRAMDALPFSSVRVPIVPWWWAVSATGVAAVWAHTPGWGRWRWLGVWGVVVSVLLMTWAAAPMTARGVGVRVDALDVGDGTCMLVRSGDDAVLWDCKAVKGAQSSLPALVRAARAVGVWRTRRAIITHPDLDHFSGLPEVIRPLGIDEVLVTQRFIEVAEQQPRGAPAALLQELQTRGVTVRTVHVGDELSIGRATLRFLWPGPATDDLSADQDNEYSAVGLLQHDGSRILLTGDVQHRAIPALLGQVGRVDVLELPHHGSYSRPCEAWLEELMPRVVIQSTGPSRAGDARWNKAKSGVPAWHVTADRGWCGVELLTSGGVRVRTRAR